MHSALHLRSNINKQYVSRKRMDKYSSAKFKDLVLLFKGRCTSTVWSFAKRMFLMQIFVLYLLYVALKK